MNGLSVACLCAALGQTAGADVSAQGQRILRAAGVQGGLIVHLGCGTGRLTAALHANDRYTVHGLDRDPANVAQARQYILSLGSYGPVAVEQFSGSALPYADNLVNLIVAEQCGAVPADELLRVLAPGGVALVRQDGGWKKLVKPRPAEIDDWSHFLHDASNNAVARDLAVGPPRRLQWVAGPLWLRSHETPSGIQAQVSAGGRIFYILDEGLIGITDPRLPDRWSLLCRDAFNGRLLWKRRLGDWGWRAWNPSRYLGKDWTVLSGTRTDVPRENQRRLVADAERLYATLAFRSPVSILEAATGRTLTTVEETDNASELLLSDGVLVVYTKSPGAGAKRRRGARPAAGQAALLGIDAASGKRLWKRPTGLIRPLLLAIDAGRVLYQTGSHLAALDLKSGELLWQVERKSAGDLTLVATDGVVVIEKARAVEARDAQDGRLLWHKKVPPISGAERQDLFVINGLVWRGMMAVDENDQPVRKSPHVLAIGWDLRTGEQKQRILVKNLRSPEHHHRCYRNKATPRYLISSMEGAEFLDLAGQNHSQNNWLRGVCRYGMMPCNGLLYVPADQCFCHPGSKLLGFTALAAAGPETGRAVPQAERLQTGPAYGKVPAASPVAGPDDWPTFRHDPARHGSTPSAVPARLSVAWHSALGGRLTAPVAAAGRLYLAAVDAHTVYALDADSGRKLWRFTAGGRIDSPPTIQAGLLLFGSHDGYVYCLRAADGQLVWRFLAAPLDRRIAAFDQVESVWPVHGSVLVHDGLAYCTAGRSTYLDGGIRVYALEPATGAVRFQTTLAGPQPDLVHNRDYSFYTLGANSELLVSEGGFIYMRQKKLTPSLQEVKLPVLSSKGAMDVGLHVFSTASLLDGSWYNRTFWMYSKRWPGFQLANQAPKSGQLLVVDQKRTYAVKVFYRRNRHSPMFFPGKEGYLVFADENTTEPQIVGEPGSRQPVAWLPQSGFARPEGLRQLDSPAFGLDKMIGYTRADPPVWTRWLPIRVRAMVKAGEVLFVAGPPDVLDPTDPYAAFEGRKGARLAALSAQDGSKLAECELASPPVFDGMIAAAGRLFLSLRDGSVVCLAGDQH